MDKPVSLYAVAKKSDELMLMPIPNYDICGGIRHVISAISKSIRKR
mgnify:CR=1 FL=1